MITDVSVDVPDDLDLTPLRGLGKQPGEEDLPGEQQEAQGLNKIYSVFLFLFNAIIPLACSFLLIFLTQNVVIDFFYYKPIVSF